MSINNRYFVFQNEFNPNMILGNMPYMGGTDSGDIYLKVPLLLVGKYLYSYAINNIIYGVCYFLKARNKPCIVLANNFLQCLPSQTTAFQNFNNKPVYLHYAGDICYFGKIRESRTDNDLRNTWYVWDYDDSDTPPLSYSNMSFASEEDWDGYHVNNQDWRSIKDIGYVIKTDGGDPQLGTRYQEYGAHVASDLETKSYSYTQMFEFADESRFYYRADDAIDLTPTEQRKINGNFAGKWITSSGTVIYIGMPIFEFTGGSESIKMIPINENSTSTVMYSDNVEYPNYRDSVTTTITRLMTGYDNDFNYSYMSIAKNHYDGTQWNFEREYYYTLGYENKEANGGYWRAEATSSIQYADEDNPPETLTWVSLNGETQKPNLICEYVGSTIEPNILYRYEKKYQSSYRYFVIKNLSQNYHYEVEE